MVGVESAANKIKPLPRSPGFALPSFPWLLLIPALLNLYLLPLAPPHPSLPSVCWSVASDTYTMLLSETHLSTRRFKLREGGSASPLLGCCPSCCQCIDCLQQFPLLPGMIIGKSLLPVIVLGTCRSFSVPSFLSSLFYILRT